MSSDVETYRILMMGRGGSGKSSIVNYYFTEQFQEEYNPTTNTEMKSTIVEFEGDNYNIEILDLPNNFESQLEILEETSSIAVIMYIVDALAEFDSTEINLELVRIRNCINQDFPIFVLGINKIDLLSSSSYDFSHFKCLANENFMFYTEISAKTGENVLELKEIIKECLKASY